MELTLADARTFLASIGITIIDPLLQLIVNKINSIDACLNGAGYSADDIGLIKYYLLALLGISQTTRTVTSQRAPSGAARSFAFGTPSQGHQQYLGLLRTLDLSGCTDDLIPADPDATSCALFVGKPNGGCC